MEMKIEISAGTAPLPPFTETTSTPRNRAEITIQLLTQVSELVFNVPATIANQTWKSFRCKLEKLGQRKGQKRSRPKKETPEKRQQVIKQKRRKGEGRKEEREITNVLIYHHVDYNTQLRTVVSIERRTALWFISLLNASLQLDKCFN